MRPSVSELEAMAEAVMEASTEASRAAKTYAGEAFADLRKTYQTRADRLEDARQLLVRILIRERERAHEQHHRSATG